MEEIICLACRRGNHKKCFEDFCTCTHFDSTGLPSVDPKPEKKYGKNRKHDHELIDPQSTGRKRAAKMYPLDPNLDCDFAGTLNAGEIPGLQGIEGCGIREGSKVGSQQARHHLDYDTLNNEPDNVVRICHSCHVLIHHKNDPLKDEYYASKYGDVAARGLQRTYKKLRGHNNE